MILIILGLIVLISVFLLWFEYQYPERIFKYGNPTERFYDLLIGFISVLIGISALFYVYTNEYTKTNKEMQIKNQQLRDHNEELEQHKNEIEKQRLVLENQNYHINESLNYARRIQKAVLSSYRVLRRQVSDSFLFYLPKERISGDFYYFAKKGDILFIVVADSTGHGVPGGFMSMLGITMLEEIVNRGEIKSAGSALDILREKIIRSLNK
jgi:serine phosphatase RsbU (regulator of sigma subunit)